MSGEFDKKCKFMIKKSLVRFPKEVCGDVEWDCWVSGHLCEDGEERPADWLGLRSACEVDLGRNGVYVWLIPKTGGDLRVLHTGISYGSSSSIRDRVLEHFSNLFKWKVKNLDGEIVLGRCDPLWSWEPTSKPNHVASDNEIYAFLRTVRILCLMPLCDSKESTISIQKLEGAVVRTSANYLGKDYITNTLRACRTCDVKHFHEVANSLNSILDFPIIPMD